MRTLSILQQLSIEGEDTSPQFLVEVALDQPYYLSTRGSQLWSGQTWQPGLIRDLRIASQAASFAVYNEDYRHTNNAIGGSYLRNRIKVWAAYMTPPLAYVDDGYWDEGYAEEGPALATPLLLFDGVISATPEVGEWLTVRCVRTPPKYYPFARIRPPIANHLPGDGYIVQFDGAILRVENAR